MVWFYLHAAHLTNIPSINNEIICNNTNITDWLWLETKFKFIGMLSDINITGITTFEYDFFGTKS